MSDSAFIRMSLFVLSGLLVWAVHFAFVYAFNTLACTRQFSSASAFGIDIVPLVVAVATAGALVAILAALALAWRTPSLAPDGSERKRVNEFTQYTTILIAGLSLVAVLWTGLPALLVSPCG